MPARTRIRALVRRLPPIARRDARIDRLKHRVRELRDRGDALDAAHAERVRDAYARLPSFQARVHTERRLRSIEVDLGLPSRNIIRLGKLGVYDFVRSHGIETPAEFGRWDSATQLPWAELPDLVVIKSSFGSTARGVWPLRRDGAGWREVGTTEVVLPEDLAASMAHLTEERMIRPPFMAEEFLDEDGTGRLPTDVKIYAFYGEVPMIVLRRPGRLGEPVSQTLFRALDEHGADLQGLETGSTVSSSLAVPALLPDAVEQARRLSLALRTPFARLDFYCLPERVVFGEITPRPGGSAWHGPVVDRLLGEAWDRAQVRLSRDLADGTSPEPQRGGR